MARPKKEGRDRLEIKAGPFGPAFFDAMSQAATAAGLSLSDYVRQRLAESMRREGFWPVTTKKKGKS